MEVIRLTADMMAELEKQLPPPVVTSQTTDLLAGYQLGVQAVLQKLRAGYVIDRG
jgi:TolB-like protein